MRHNSNLKYPHPKQKQEAELIQLQGTAINDPYVSHHEASEEESNFSTLLSFVFVLSYRFTHRKGPSGFSPRRDRDTAGGRSETRTEDGFTGSAAATD